MTAMILGGLGVLVGLGVHLLGATRFDFGVMVAGIGIIAVSTGAALVGLCSTIFG